MPDAASPLPVRRARPGRLALLARQDRLVLQDLKDRKDPKVQEEPRGQPGIEVRPAHLDLRDKWVLKAHRESPERKAQ